MENLSIKDEDITASSSFDSGNVGPQNGRWVFASAFVFLRSLNYANRIRPSSATSTQLDWIMLVPREYESRRKGGAKKIKERNSWNWPTDLKKMRSVSSDSDRWRQASDANREYENLKAPSRSVTPLNLLRRRILSGLWEFKTLPPCAGAINNAPLGSVLPSLQCLLRSMLAFIVLAGGFRAILLCYH